MSRRSHLGFASVLYVSQYLGIGFLYFGLTSILRSEGTELNDLAAVQLIGSLWLVKALWAPLVDRFALFSGGHYRSWLMITQPLMALSLLALAPLSEPATQLTATLTLVAIFIATSATQDIATDAIVTRYMPENLQGWANSAATIGSWLGNILGGGVVLIIYDRFGWVPAVVTLALMTLLPLPFVLTFTEDTGPPKVSLRQRYREMAGVFGQPGVARWAILVLLPYWAGAVSAYALIPPALTDAGWSLTRIGIVMGMAMTIPASIGAVASGWFIRVLGLGLSCLLGGVGIVLTAPAMWFALAPGAADSTIVVGLACYIAAMSLVTTTVHSAHMWLARPDYAGSDFTVITSTGMLWTAVGNFAILTIAATTGYSFAAAAFAALCIPGSVLAFWTIRRRSATTPAAPPRPASPVE